MSAESAQTLKYQAALARVEERLAAVTAERDAVTARAEKAEHTLLHSSVSGYLARCVELEASLSTSRAQVKEFARRSIALKRDLLALKAALSEAAARNRVLTEALEGIVAGEGERGLNPFATQTPEDIARVALSAPAVVDPKVEALLSAARDARDVIFDDYGSGYSTVEALDDALAAWGKR